ncbi:hypothetical protein PAXRUDRAFT_830641 [Paxillus rubicundulus Ve08.2h10]|uniref:Uncharacterized protein n=1 Tax=Paxillus rubicundulus Ve08.2h10 TaxID=930991 RepID=A0A0D0DKF3_9AGAM|nr:hypothetical protein PAXRUDRAFT_830641 [Paxillus rubicundulus Ve08.2h10]
MHASKRGGNERSPKHARYVTHVARLYSKSLISSKALRTLAQTQLKPTAIVLCICVPRTNISVLWEPLEDSTWRCPRNISRCPGKGRLRQEVEDKKGETPGAQRRTAGLTRYRPDYRLVRHP